VIAGSIAPRERRDAILSTLSWAAATLLGTEDWRAAVPELLRRLGAATDASRICLAENSTRVDGRIEASLIDEWLAPDAPPRRVATTPRLQYSGRIVRQLRRGESFDGLVRDMSPPERAFFELHDVQALFCVPIFCGAEWWGMLAIDDCRAERRRTQPETDALRAAAPILGGAIARARAEASLRESEVRYRDLAGLGSDWYWEQDENLRFTYLSRDVEAVSGFPAEAFLGKTRHETRPIGLSEQEWARHLDDLAHHRPFRDLAFQRLDPQGRMHWYMTSGIPMQDREGRFRGYRGIGRDVTAQVEAESALRAKDVELEASHRTLRSALDSMSEGFTLWDRDDRLVLWNRRHLEMFPVVDGLLRPGVSYESLLRHNVQAGSLALGDRTAEEHIRATVAAHRSGGAREVHAANGRVFAVREYRTAEGGIVRLDSDITEYKRRERALVEAREQAETANRAKSAFIANMSHELRTPLNAIIGFADILRNGMFGPLSDRYRHYADDIAHSGEHLLALINDLLDVAKVEAGKYELHREPVSLAALVDETCRVLAPRAAEAKVRLENRVRDDLPPWRIDRRAIGQVLLNLLSNAVKFRQDRGSAAVEARVEDAMLVLAVIDDGIGIPASELPRLTQPFEQIENVWTRSRQGTGLGLAISKSLVELHGCTLTI